MWTEAHQKWFYRKQPLRISHTKRHILRRKSTHPCTRQLTPFTTKSQDPKSSYSTWYLDHPLVKYCPIYSLAALFSHQVVGWKKNNLKEFLLSGRVIFLRFSGCFFWILLLLLWKGFFKTTSTKLKGKHVFQFERPPTNFVCLVVHYHTGFTLHPPSL